MRATLPRRSGRTSIQSPYPILRVLLGNLLGGGRTAESPTRCDALDRSARGLLRLLLARHVGRELAP
ncbi:MAG: hypothetical protein ACYDHT_12980, partial [Solirubrobacteraceae bacterium]